MSETRLFTCPGRSDVTTTLNDDELLEAIKRIPVHHKDANFAGQLIHHQLSRSGLSQKQTYWFVKLATEQYSREQEKPQFPICVVPNIVNFMHPATVKRKTGACITFQLLHAGHDLPNDGTIRIKQGVGDPGIYWIDSGEYTNNGGALYAKIDKQAQVWGVKDQPITTPVLVMLDEFEADPKLFIIRYGKRTGKCCFCNATLDTPISVSLGYGPVCGKNYDLPTGRKGLAEVENLLQEDTHVS